MRKHLVIGIISAGILAYQLLIMHILSMTQWHHFGFMIISVALLGFGAAGTLLSVTGEKRIGNWKEKYPWLILLTGLFMLFVIPATQLAPFRFDSYLVFVSPLEKFKLLTTYVLYFLPFFSGALAIGLYLILNKETIGLAYFINLLGSALGSGLIILAMWYIKPQYISIAISVSIFIAALIDIPSQNKRIYLLILALGLCSALIQIIFAKEYRISQYKSLSSALQLPDTRVIQKGFSPYGSFHEVESPLLRHAPGLSLNYGSSLPAVQTIFVNGNFKGALSPHHISDSNYYFRYSVFELPYQLLTPHHVLILDGAEGTNLSLALNHQCENIVVVDSDPMALSWTESELNRLPGSQFRGIEFHQSELRSFIMKDTSQYDLITLPTLGNFGGISGINAIKEDYLLTVTAVSDIFQKLSRNGAMAIATYIDSPGRYPYRLLTTLVQALNQAGVAEPNSHIIAIRNWNAVIFVVMRQAIGDYSNVNRFCSEMCFDLVIPQLEEPEAEECNRLQDTSFTGIIKKLTSTKQQTIYDNYSFRINPTDDDQPFFHQFIKLNSYDYLIKMFGKVNLPFFELGYYIVLFAFLQTSIIAFFLILLPLLVRKITVSNKLNILIYFSCLALGYMFLEIVFIHQFILYFGNAIYASAATISIMMLFSGMGSYFSDELIQTKKWLIWLVLLISLFVLFIQFFSLNLLYYTIQYPMLVKMFIALLIVAPVSFLMGIPFPAGIKKLCNDSGSMAWAWGINGYLSVISVPLATIIAVEWGYRWVFILVSGLYLLTLTSLCKVKAQ